MPNEMNDDEALRAHASRAVSDAERALGAAIYRQDLRRIADQGNRWAAFTDDELEALADDFDPGLGIGARCAPDGSVMAELVAEIERRQS